MKVPPHCDVDDLSHMNPENVVSTSLHVDEVAMNHGTTTRYNPACVFHRHVGNREKFFWLVIWVPFFWKNLIHLINYLVHSIKVVYCQRLATQCISVNFVTPSSNQSNVVLVDDFPGSTFGIFQCQTKFLAQKNSQRYKVNAHRWLPKDRCLDLIATKDGASKTTLISGASG